MRQLRKSMRGFSLIELMVGVVIAIIASIIMFQVFAFSERQKRTTTGASDAQVNGALALDAVEREVRMAGFGLSNSVFATCDPAKTYSYFNPGGSGSTGTTLGAISQPVSITQGTNGADSIRIFVSATDFSANYSPGTTCLRDTMPSSSSELKVQSTHGCPDGSLAMLVQGTTSASTTAGTCTLIQITHANASSLQIQHNPGTGGNDPTYNPPNSYQNSNNWPAYTVSSSTGCEAYLVCMGSTVDAIGTTFSVNTTARELLRDGVAITPGIMDMQAQYGLVAGPTGTPTWQEPTGTWAASATLTQAQIQQIKAVRVALIARSGEYEKPTNVAGTCDTTTSTANLSTWATFDTTNWPNDWQCYRYKVFETVIPLRNVIWSAT